MKFGTGHRSSMENLQTRNFPGPSLLPDLNSIKKSSPNFGFGTDKRKPMGNEKMSPGPGNYAIPTIVGKEGRQVSMHQLIKYSPIEKEQIQMPGPGNYEGNSLKVKKKEPSYKIGSGSRFDTM